MTRLHGASGDQASGPSGNDGRPHYCLPALSSSMLGVIRTQQLRNRNTELAKVVTSCLQFVPAHHCPGIVSLIHRRVQLDVIEIAERQSFRAEGSPYVSIRTVDAVLMPTSLRKITTLVEDPGRNQGSIPVEHECLEIKGLAFAQVLFLERGSALAADSAHAFADQLFPCRVVGSHDLACHEHVKSSSIARGLADHGKSLGGLIQDAVNSSEHVVSSDLAGRLSTIG